MKLQCKLHLHYGHPFENHPGPFQLMLRGAKPILSTPEGITAELYDGEKIGPLLRDPIVPSPYAFRVVRKGTEFWVRITIAPSYIENICRHTWLVPPILTGLFKPPSAESIGYNLQESQIPIAAPHINFNQIGDPVLYPYQKGNLAWMLELEQTVLSGGNRINYYFKDQIYALDRQGLYFDRAEGVLYDKAGLLASDHWQSYTYTGGILCDEVGLGKTLSMLRLIEHAPQGGMTLILCPRRLVSQWMGEFKKYTGVAPYEMSTMFHVNKFRQEPRQVVIASLSLLENKTYYSADTKVLNEVQWARLIIDEGHEILRFTNKDVHTLTDIFNLRATCKWICSGTPLAYGEESLIAMLALLGNRPNGKTSELLENCTLEQFDQLLNTLFHRNTRESIKSQIYVPQIEYQLDTLDFTPTERAMYDALPEGDVTRKLQMCSNISISDKDTSIMGGGVILSIDQVNKAMGSHYKTLCEEIQTDLDSSRARITFLTDEQAKTTGVMLADIANCKNPEEQKVLKAEKTKRIASYRNRIKTLHEHVAKYEASLVDQQKQLQKFRSLDLTHLKFTDCPILGLPLSTVETAITTDGCYYSRQGLELLFTGNRKEITCPCTGKPIKPSEILYTTQQAVPDIETEIGTWGTKIAHVVKRLRSVLTDFPGEKIIIFSRWNRMLKLVGNVLQKVGLKHVFCQGNVHVVSNAIRLFKTEPEVKIILLSSENCSSGCNLTEASHIFLLDTVNEDKVLSLAINEQAIGRAARLGQMRTVHVYTFVIRDTVEEEYYAALSR